jgi:hypothetical protein
VKEEFARGIVPIHRWRYTHESAEKGLCKMPDPSPPQAAKMFLERRKPGSSAKKKRFVILMLGLSYMGEPFQSLGCLYGDQIIGGFARDLTLPKGETSNQIDVNKIRNNGGQCTGYDRKEIMKYFPYELHQNFGPIPKQNFENCNLHHGQMIFQSPDPDDGTPTVEVCYVYLFNVAKNKPKGSTLPCSLSWEEVDVVFSMPEEKEILDLYIPHTGGDVKKLDNLHILMVNRVYEGLMAHRLNDAYKREGFKVPTPQDHRSKFDRCGPDKSDTHLRMPGIPDYAVQLWLQFMATGFDAGGYKTRGQVKYWI